MWFQLVVILVSALLSYLLKPKPEQPKPASLTDFTLPTAEAGRPVPVIFGRPRIKGANVIWYGDLGTRPIKTKSGKK
jgi:hypothetical protein